MRQSVSDCKLALLLLALFLLVFFTPQRVSYEIASFSEVFEAVTTRKIADSSIFFPQSRLKMYVSDYVSAGLV